MLATYPSVAMNDEQAAAHIARALADRTRVRLLVALAEGDATVSDLAARLDLPQPRVSTHLAVLRAAELVTALASGRQRTYHADAGRVAALIESLSLPPADGTPPRRSAAADRQVRADSALRRARTCYDHLAGVAGVEVLDHLLQRGWLVTGAGARPDYMLTAAGRRALAERGVDVEQTERTRRTFAAGCLDWTERRPHLAGALGAAVLRALEGGQVVQRQSGTRMVALSRPVTAWLTPPAV